jgi:hypothetical protein
MFNLHFTYLELWTIYSLSFIIDNAVDPDPGFWLPKIVKFYIWQKLLFVLIKNWNFFIQPSKENRRHLKTSSINFGPFCSPGSGSGSSRQKSMRILADLDPDPHQQHLVLCTVCRRMKVIRQEESVFDIVLSDKICWPDCEFFHYYI